MTRLPILAIAAFGLALAGSARADEAIPTAAGGVGAPASAPPPSDLEQPSPFAADDEIERIGPCGDIRPASAPADRKPHGQVEVGVGTGGYRHVAAAVCKPIGENGAVAVAIDYTKWDGGRRRHLAEVDGWRSPDGLALPPVDGRAR